MSPLKTLNRRLDDSCYSDLLMVTFRLKIFSKLYFNPKDLLVAYYIDVWGE